MKKQYTKKQITEAIAYWQKQLMLCESSEIENEVCNHLKSIIDTTVNSLSYKIGGGSHIYEGHPKKTHFANDKYDWGKYNIFHTGNAKNTSDIYISFPVTKEQAATMTVDDLDFVGIEVKESPTSKLFNPQLIYSRDTGEFQFSNEFLDPQDESVKEFFSELLPGENRLWMKVCIERLIKWFANFGIDMSSLPWKYTEDRFNSQRDILAYIFYKSFKSFTLKSSGEIVDRDEYSQQEFYDKYLEALKTKNIASLIDTREHQHAEIELFYSDSTLKMAQFLDGKIKRIKLASYNVYDNSIIKSYFNSLRSKSDTYMPVYYIQFGDALYRLIDDNSKQSRFFKSNGTYKVLPYDSAFGGVRITWYIDFSNKDTDKYIRIKGDVTSINNSGKQASLTNIGKDPLVDIPKSYLYNLNKYID